MSLDNLYLNESDDQFVISYELICLLKWIIEHEEDGLKKIITKGLHNDLKESIEKKDSDYAEHTLEEIQQTILEFFAIAESLLLETINEQAVKKALEKNLIPAIDQIDSTVCDDATVRFSIEKATSKIDKNLTKESPKEILFKELLKRWKPSKKNIIN